MRRTGLLPSPDVVRFDAADGSGYSWSFISRIVSSISSVVLEAAKLDSRMYVNYL